METIFMNMENSKTNEPHKFVLNLSQRLDLKSQNKYVALENLSIYYTWKNMRKQYKNNKLKTIAPIWNEEFELPDGNNEIIWQHKKITEKKYQVLKQLKQFQYNAIQQIININKSLKYHTLIQVYLLNVELSYLVFLKTFYTEFDVVVIKFTDQNGRPLEIEDQVNLTLLIDKYK